MVKKKSVVANQKQIDRIRALSQEPAISQEDLSARERRIGDLEREGLSIKRATEQAGLELQGAQQQRREVQQEEAKQEQIGQKTEQFIFEREAAGTTQADIIRRQTAETIEEQKEARDAQKQSITSAIPVIGSLKAAVTGEPQTQGLLTQGTPSTFFQIYDAASSVFSSKDPLPVQRAESTFDLTTSALTQAENDLKSGDISLTEFNARIETAEMANNFFNEQSHFWQNQRRSWWADNGLRIDTKIEQQKLTIATMRTNAARNAALGDVALREKAVKIVEGGENG